MQVHTYSPPPFTPTLLIIALFFLLLTLVKQRKRHDQAASNYNLPPGPWKLPLIGNLHQLISSEPWQVLRDLAKVYGPLMHLKIGEISTVVISSPRVTKQLLKTHELAFLDRPDLNVTRVLFYDGSDMGFAPCGDWWRQMRKICARELLGSKVVKSFASIREDEVSNLMTKIRSSSSSSIVNLSCEIYHLTSAILSRAAFGEKLNGQEDLLALLKDHVDALTEGVLSDVFPSLSFIGVVLGTNRKLERMHKKVDCIMNNIIRERRQQLLDVLQLREDNLLDVLIRIQENGGLEFKIEDNHIKANIFQLLILGTDPTSSAMEWAFSEMLKNPRVMHKAQGEVRSLVLAKDSNKTIQEADLERLSYLKMIIKETLRLHPAAPLIPRLCTQTCEIDGYTIPVNTKVIVNLCALGRDPNFWDDAESFIPERFENSFANFAGNDPFEYIPFGIGKRICPGISFALPMIELPLANLLYHFDWQLTSGTRPEDLDMTANSSSTRRKNDLYAIAISATS